MTLPKRAKSGDVAQTIALPMPAIATALVGNGPKGADRRMPFDMGQSRKVRIEVNLNTSLTCIHVFCFT